MPEYQLGLLKSLTMRPTRSVAANLTPLLSALHAAGYVTLGPGGWMATAAGCALIEHRNREDKYKHSSGLDASAR